MRQSAAPPVYLQPRLLSVVWKRRGLFNGDTRTCDSPSLARRRQRLALEASTTSGGASSSSSSSSISAELIPYTPIKKGEVYDLRLYEAYPVAQVEYARRDEGFLELGSYMSGENAAGARMRETQPMVMCHHPEGRKVMRVRISPRDPAAAAQPPPAPSNPAVGLDIAGGEIVAVVRFEGNATPEVAAAQRRRLEAALAADGLALAPAEAAGFFRIAQYGELYSLSTRVNELWLAVQLG